MTAAVRDGFLGGVLAGPAALRRRPARRRLRRRRSALARLIPCRPSRLVEMFPHDFLPLLVAPPFLAPCAMPPNIAAQRSREPSGRWPQTIGPNENCVDRMMPEKEQRQDQDDRAGAIQIRGQKRREPIADDIRRREMSCPTICGVPNASDRNDDTQPKSRPAPMSFV